MSFLWLGLGLLIGVRIALHLAHRPTVRADTTARMSHAELLVYSARLDHELWPDETDWDHPDGCGPCKVHRAFVERIAERTDKINRNYAAIEEYHRTGNVSPDLFALVDTQGRPLVDPRLPKPPGPGPEPDYAAMGYQQKWVEVRTLGQVAPVRIPAGWEPPEEQR